MPGTVSRLEYGTTSLASKKNKDPYEENAGFFAVIPATVRYDKSLPQGAKLLYGEITALVKKKGYCWSRNPYFAELYDISERTIIEWIWRLHAAGHIDIYFKYFPCSKKIARRYIALPYPPNKELPPELAEAHFMKRKPPSPEGLAMKKTSPLEPSEKPPDNGPMVKESSPLIVKKTSVPECIVVKKTSPPSSEENSLVIYTNSNRSSSSDPPGIENTPLGEEEGFERTDNNAENRALENSPEESGPQADPLPGNSQEGTFDIHSLKRLLRELNPSFVFSEPFYQKAVDFLAFNRLGRSYISWFYNFCVRQKPASIENYFYKVFFDARCAELYLVESGPLAVEKFRCPACSKEHDPGLLECPACGLSLPSRKNPKEIFKRKKLFEMPPDIKAAYDEEFDNMYESAKCLSFKEKNMLLNSLEQKYGLTE